MNMHDAETTLQRWCEKRNIDASKIPDDEWEQVVDMIEEIVSNFLDEDEQEIFVNIQSNWKDKYPDTEEAKKAELKRK